MKKSYGASMRIGKNTMAARVKLNFFYVVLVGGRVLLLIGAVLTLATLVRLIRRDTQMKIKSLLRLAEADDG